MKFNRQKIFPLSLGSVILSLSPGLHGCAGDRAGVASEKPLNVLFFFVDDLRPELGCYGDSMVHTPNIDRLAGNGLVFTRAYCQQAVSNPSRTSLLTGLRPDEDGVTDLETHFRDKVPEVTTLPQLFKNNGYLTLGAGKVYHATPYIVDDLSWTRPIPPYKTRNYLLPENQVGTRKQNASEAADVQDTAYTDGKTAQYALQYLEEAQKTGKPFFLAIGFNKPHLPFNAPKKYWDLYRDHDFLISNRERPAGSPELAFHHWEELRGYRDIPDSGALSTEKEQQLWQGYYACISYVDAQIGKVMDKLEETGRLENTIIVLWGDHGYHLGEQDTWCKSTNFELDARVPLIISAPGAAGNGRYCDAIVETLDIYPTLAGLCGLEPESPLSGISLQPLLNDPGKKWDQIAFNQFIRPYAALRNGKPSHMGYSVRTDKWRCTWWWDLATDQIVEKELYDLSGNRVEKKNLSGIPEYADIESELGKLLVLYREGRYVKK